MTGNHDNRKEPILVIDFGTSYSTAYLIVPGRDPVQVVEPGHGARWASAVLADRGALVVGNAAKERKPDVPDNAFRSEFKRDLGPGAAPILLGDTPYRPEQLMLETVRAIAAAARRQLAELIPEAELGRTVLTVPAFYARNRPLRELMFSVLEDAVPGPVQLLPEPVAAAWGLRLDPSQRNLLLVYDFGGGTFDAALVEIGPGDDSDVLGLDSELVGGKDIDVDLARLLRGQAGHWLDTQLSQVSGQQAETRRYRFEAATSAAAEELKVRLSRSESGTAPAKIPGYPEQVWVTREQLNDLARPHIEATIACYRRLLAAQHKTPADLSAVLLVGGTTLMPLVPAMLKADLLPEIPPQRQEQFPIGDLGLKPDVAVAFGAARWAIKHTIEEVRPQAPRPGGSVLRWRLDDPAARGSAAARLMGWQAEPGRHYKPGDTLARVRYADGTLWDLTASEPGVLGAVLADPPETVEGDENGLPIESCQWIATAERSRPER